MKAQNLPRNISSQPKQQHSNTHFVQCDSQRDTIGSPTSNIYSNLLKMSLGFIINPNFVPLIISPPRINKYTPIVTHTHTHKDRNEFEVQIK